MFSVLFEVNPKPEQFNTYLGYAKMLRPELEEIDGFVDNIRYRSLTREGWILSLSNWRDEKAVVRWRTRMRHHEIQEKGRGEVFRDYHLRVGQLTKDTRLPDGYELREQRLDETEVGQATTVTLMNARLSGDAMSGAVPDVLAEWLGLRKEALGLVTWDVFDAVLDPGDLILLLSWKNEDAARAYRVGVGLPDGFRFRSVRIVRDYGMFDRREAPQYFPEVLKD